MDQSCYQSSQRAVIWADKAIITGSEQCNVTTVRARDSEENTKPKRSALLLRNTTQFLRLQKLKTWTSPEMLRGRKTPVICVGYKGFNL